MTAFIYISSEHKLVISYSIDTYRGNGGEHGNKERRVRQHQQREQNLVKLAKCMG